MGQVYECRLCESRSLEVATGGMCGCQKHPVIHDHYLGVCYNCLTEWEVIHVEHMGYISMRAVRDTYDYNDTDERSN